MNAILKIPTEMGYKAVYTETDSDKVSYSNTTVTEVLNKSLSTENVSAYMQNLINKDSAAQVRKALGVYREKFYDECGVNWAVSGVPMLSPAGAKFKNAVQLNGDVAAKCQIELGGQDFTAEAWVTFKLTDSSWGIIFSMDDADYLLFQNKSPSAFCVQTSSAFTVPASADTLYHVEVDYNHSEGKIYLYVNGTLGGSYSLSFARKVRDFWLGDNYAGNSWFVGSLSEFRLSDGICRHNANFTPSNETYSVDEHTVSLLHFD